MEKKRFGALTCSWFSLRARGVFCSHRLFSISLVLRLSATSHLLAPAGSITISLGWLLLLLALWWNWEGWLSSSCACPLGRSWLLGHQLGCCRGFVESEMTPPPRLPAPSSSSSSPFLWSDVIASESGCHCQGDCVHCAPCEPYWCHSVAQNKVRGQQSANVPSMTPVGYDVN